MNTDLARIEKAFFTKHWRWELFSHASAQASTLIDFLKKKLSHLDSNSWTERFNWGGVYVNGLAARTDLVLSYPCKIEYYEPKCELNQLPSFYADFKREYILYEDEYLIAAFKPDRLPCMPAREQLHCNLKNYLEKYSGKKVHVPSRLDTSTSGVVVVSKNERMHNLLQKRFEQRRISKHYLLHSVESVPWLQLKARSRISHSRQHAVLREVSLDCGRESLTDFCLVSPGSDPGKPGSIVHAKPLSGRTHQIRLHAAYLGFPITGDNFYGGALASELRLLSFAVSFEHPLTQEKLKVSVPPSLRPNWAKTALEQLERFSS